MENSSVMAFLDELEREIAARRIETARQAAWKEAEAELDRALSKLDRFQTEDREP